MTTAPTPSTQKISRHLGIPMDKQPSEVTRRVCLRPSWQVWLQLKIEASVWHPHFALHYTPLCKQAQAPLCLAFESDVLALQSNFNAVVQSHHLYVSSGPHKPPNMNKKTNQNENLTQKQASTFYVCAWSSAETYLLHTYIMWRKARHNTTLPETLVDFPGCFESSGPTSRQRDVR